MKMKMKIIVLAILAIKPVLSETQTPIINVKTNQNNIDDTNIQWAKSKDVSTCSTNKLDSNNTNIRCETKQGTNTNNVQVSLAGTEPDPNKWSLCADGTPSNLQASGKEDRTIYANGTSNSGTYDGNFSSFQGAGLYKPWPGTVGETISLSLTKGMYISAKFNSGAAELKGEFQYAGTGNTQGPNARRGTTTISTCPGNFDRNHLGQANCFKDGSGNLLWSTDPAANPAYYCMLEKNKTYYLNIIHSDNSEGDDYNTSDCDFPYCGILAQYSNSTL